jgi:hypothetical protein
MGLISRHDSKYFLYRHGVELQITIRSEVVMSKKLNVTFKGEPNLNKLAEVLSEIVTKIKSENKNNPKAG